MSVYGLTEIYGKNRGYLYIFIDELVIPNFLMCCTVPTQNFLSPLFSTDFTDTSETYR